MIISKSTTKDVVVSERIPGSGSVYSDIARFKCQGTSLSSFVGSTVPVSLESGLSESELIEYRSFLEDTALRRYVYNVTHTSFLDPESILAQSMHNSGWLSKLESVGGKGKAPAPFAVPASMPGYRGRLSVAVLCGYLAECESLISTILRGGNEKSGVAFPLDTLRRKYGCSFPRLCRLLLKAKQEYEVVEQLLGLYNRRILQARRVGGVSQEMALRRPEDFVSSDSVHALQSLMYFLDVSELVGCNQALNFSRGMHSALAVPLHEDSGKARSFSYTVSGKKEQVLTVPATASYSLRVWLDFQSVLREYLLGPLLDAYPLQPYRVIDSDRCSGSFSLEENRENVSYRVLSCLTSASGRIEIGYSNLLSAYEILREVNYIGLPSVEALLLFLGGMEFFWDWSAFVRMNVPHSAAEVERINPQFSPSLKDFGSLVSARGLTGVSVASASDVLVGPFRGFAPWVFLPESMSGIRLRLVGGDSTVESLQRSAHMFGPLLDYLRSVSQSNASGVYPYFVTHDSVCLMYHPDYLPSEFDGSSPEDVFRVLKKHLPVDLVLGKDYLVDCISELSPSLGVFFPFLGSVRTSHFSELSLEDASESTFYLLSRKDGRGGFVLPVNAGVIPPKSRWSKKDWKYSHSAVRFLLSQEYGVRGFEAGKRYCTLWYVPGRDLLHDFTGFSVEVGTRVCRLDCFFTTSGSLVSAVCSDYEVLTLYKSDGSSRLVRRGGYRVLSVSEFPPVLVDSLVTVSERLFKEYPVASTETSFSAYAPKDAYLFAAPASGVLPGPDWVPVS